MGLNGPGNIGEVASRDFSIGEPRGKSACTSSISSAVCGPLLSVRDARCHHQIGARYLHAAAVIAVIGYGQAGAGRIFPEEDLRHLSGTEALDSGRCRGSRCHALAKGGTRPRVWPGTSVILAPEVTVPKRRSSDCEMPSAPSISDRLKISLHHVKGSACQAMSPRRDGLFHLFPVGRRGLV